MRSTRNQPFCWQEKHILRFLRKKFKGTELVKYRNLYLTLSEIESDFNGKDLKYYTKTLCTYSGLPRDWVPKALKLFEGLGIISFNQCYDEKTKRPLYKELLFTPDNIEESHDNTNHGIVDNVTVNPTHKKIVSFKEDSTNKKINKTLSQKPLNAPCENFKTNNEDDFCNKCSFPRNQHLKPTLPKKRLEPCKNFRPIRKNGTICDNCGLEHPDYYSLFYELNDNPYGCIHEYETESAIFKQYLRFYSPTPKHDSHPRIKNTQIKEVLEIFREHLETKEDYRPIDNLTEEWFNKSDRETDWNIIHFSSWVKGLEKTELQVVT